MKLRDLAHALGAELRGDGDLAIERVAGIEDAGPGDLTFVANPRYARHLATTRASAVLVARGAPEVAVATLVAKDPYLAFAKAIELFYREPELAPGIHPTAVIDPSARLGEGARIAAYAVIGARVEVGPGARIHPHVVIYEGARIGARFTAHAHAVVREHVRLGDDVTLQPGAVIGGDGFGFARGEDGRHRKIVQSGIVVLEDDVEVQANATIDRATVGETRVGAGTKIDNLVQVGHGSRIGRRCLLASQTGIAGSSVLGDGVMLGGQVGVAGHLTIGDGVVAAAQSGIPSDVAAGSAIGGGVAAVELPRYRRIQAVYRKLPEMHAEVARLRREVERLAAAARGLDAGAAVPAPAPSIEPGAASATEAACEE